MLRLEQTWEVAALETPSVKYLKSNELDLVLEARLLLKIIEFDICFMMKV